MSLLIIIVWFFKLKIYFLKLRKYLMSLIQLVHKGGNTEFQFIKIKHLASGQATMYSYLDLVRERDPIHCNKGSEFSCVCVYDFCPVIM